MNARLALRLAWVAAAVSVVTGIAFAAGTAARVGATRARLASKVSAFAALREMQDRLLRHEAACRVFEALPRKRPRSPAELLELAVAGNVAREVREAERAPAFGGWTVRRCDISLTGAALAEAAAFAAAAEAARPPWRLVKCDVRADPRAPGSGRVALRVEALEK